MTDIEPGSTGDGINHSSYQLCHNLALIIQKRESYPSKALFYSIEPVVVDHSNGMVDRINNGGITRETLENQG